MIRRKTILCGAGQRPEYLEADVYIYKNLHVKAKGKRKGKSSKKQRDQNDKNSKRYFNQLVKANFCCEGCQRIDLTYTDDNRPHTQEDADRYVDNFLKRLKRARKKKGIQGEVRYIIIDEHGKSGKIHHHLLLANSGMDENEINRLWMKKKQKIGITRTDILQYDQNGLVGLINYITKEMYSENRPQDGQMSIEDLISGNDRKKNKKRWRQSKNLILPYERVRDRAYSNKQFNHIVSLPPDCEEVRRFFEKDYPGYDLTDIRYQFNDVTATWGVYMSFHRRD